MHQEVLSPEVLQDTIRCFWYESREMGEHRSSFEVIPDGYAEIIFHFGNGCSIASQEGLQPLPSPFLVGLLNQPVLFYTQHRMEIIGVRCFPWTVFDLLGLPSGREGVYTFEHPLAELHPMLEKYLKEDRVAEALTQITHYFVQARAQVSVDSMLFKAGVAMRKAKGTLSVRQIAEAAHATVRTLERKFKQSSGHTVKTMSGLMRFEQVRNHLWHFPDSSLAGLAHELGYTDQAHLSREFKRYSGTTPAAFARKVKKGKQAVRPDLVTFIPA